MTLKAALTKELADMPPPLQSSPLAALAQLLVERLENADLSTTAPISRQLVQVLGLLRAEKAKLAVSGDVVDELKARRKTRRGGISDGTAGARRVSSKRGVGSGRVGGPGARRGAN